MGTRISPLVIDLGNNGVALSPRRVPFDLAATGERVEMPGIGKDDALLALDLDGNGRIDSGAELFGNSTLCSNRRCTDGVEALAQHDSNQDGVLDARDPVFFRLRLWQDRDHDGRSRPTELRPLRLAGIRSISLASRLDLSWSNALASATRALVFSRDEQPPGTIWDVWFNVALSSFPRHPRTTGIPSTLPLRFGAPATR